ANLANLVMARGESRRREFVLRAALGASRGRLLRQAVTEGVLVSGAGGVRALIRAYPTSVPRTSDVAIDGPVLLVALGLTAGTAVLIGLALAGRRVGSLVTALKEGGDRGVSGLGRSHLRRALVMSEVALAAM